MYLRANIINFCIQIKEAIALKSTFLNKFSSSIAKYTAYLKSIHPNNVETKLRSQSNFETTFLPKIPHYDKAFSGWLSEMTFDSWCTKREKNTKFGLPFIKCTAGAKFLKVEREVLKISQFCFSLISTVSCTRRASRQAFKF